MSLNNKRDKMRSGVLTPIELSSANKGGLEPWVPIKHALHLRIKRQKSMRREVGFSPTGGTIFIRNKSQMTSRKDPINARLHKDLILCVMKLLKKPFTRFYNCDLCNP